MKLLKWIKRILKQSMCDHQESITLAHEPVHIMFCPKCEKKMYIKKTPSIR